MAEYRFDFEKLLHPENAAFSAVTGMPIAAERRRRIGACKIDVHHTCPQSGSYVTRRIGLVMGDVRGESVS